MATRPNTTSPFIDKLLAPLPEGEEAADTLEYCGQVLTDIEYRDGLLTREAREAAFLTNGSAFRKGLVALMNAAMRESLRAQAGEA